MPVRHAAEDLCQSGRATGRRSRGEGAAAGGRDGSHPEVAPSRVVAVVRRQASADHRAVPSSSAERRSPAGGRAVHGRAAGRHPQRRQEQQLNSNSEERR